MIAIRRLILMLVAVATLAVGTALPVSEAHAQDGWQFHLAQANTFYRNRLLPKALSELKLVVADPEGKKQLKAWQLIIEISSKLRDLDSLIWALEGGREIAQGQDAAQMQAQLYRLKRVYGRVKFEATGGSGKLPDKGIKLKIAEEPGDPEAKAYYEKARTVFGQSGYSVGQMWLPAGLYVLDGEQLKIVAGKDTTVEVAPTTDITFHIEVAGSGGGRIGDDTTGTAGFLGGLTAGAGPHIQFAGGNSLLIQAGAILLFGPQSTADVQQDAFSNDERAGMSLGGGITVGFEFAVGAVDLSPRIGYAAYAMPGGMYYRGKVRSSPPDAVTGVLEGEFIVPTVAHGPRLGIQALLTPALIKGKRRPRVFAGVHAGPLFAHPLWGEVEVGTEVAGESTTVRDTNDATSELYGGGPFAVDSIVAGDEASSVKIFVDVQAVVGVQVRF